MRIRVAALIGGLLVSGSGSAWAGGTISFTLSQMRCDQEAPRENSTPITGNDHCIELLQRECQSDLDYSPEIKKTKDRLEAYSKTDSTFDTKQTTVAGRFSHADVNRFYSKEYCFESQDNKRHCHRIRVYDQTEYTSTCKVNMGIASTHSVSTGKTPRIRKVTSTTSNACIAVENELLADPAVVQSIIRSTVSGPLSPPSECWVEYHVISRN